MATLSLFFYLISLLSLLTFSSSSTSPDTITISLSPFTRTPHSNLWQRLNRLVSSSLSRTHLIKHPHKNNSLTKTSVFPESYGGYSIPLSFGTPPQTLSFVMDTGSSLTWFPCTQRYDCFQCNFPNINPKNISTFFPKRSSSAKLLGCRNEKCGLIFGPDVNSRCRGCDGSSGNCTQTCPVYLVQYGSGATTGFLLSEKLVFPDKIVSDFVVGCSLFSSQQPSGIAGFGRGPESLPAQMGLKRFSYCLVSHSFDGSPVSSDLVLVGGSDSGDGKSRNVSYTPFRKNRITPNSIFREYYYVTLRKITVGGVNVKVPYSFLVPGSDGNGGTMVDSGTTFTSMDEEAYELVTQAFEKQMAHYSRNADVENQSGLRPCFDISGKKPLFYPKLIFHFKGGAKMDLPMADYFSFEGSSAVCMTIVSNGADSRAFGPSIVIGNYQQQNFYMEYDLENERLGFRKQICK
ncbi:unnamed protein product [Ilex paraguariensis]|uniref:Aspartyl protease n=1 Tax=Ilex paraguariensis TaxID=185542 RepID=A0ABC8UHR8_9AQUA